MKKIKILTLFTFIIFVLGCVNRETVIYHDDFNELLNSEIWKVEMDSLPGSNVFTKNGRLVLDTKGGVTVWLKKELSGNYIIEYERTVVLNGGNNDRLSDLNQFWMATDPKSLNLFTRNGRFEEYDSLLLYYVGFGGNSNTTTRFRKYLGNGEKNILNERNDFLLEANKLYKIKISVVDGVISYWVNGSCLFLFNDPEPFEKGYFGFRSTWSRHEIDNIKIYRLNNKPE